MSDYISIRGISTGPSLSGYDIYDLEGMNLKRASAIANIDNLTGEAFLKDKIRLGCKLTDDDVFIYMQKLFRTNDIVGSGIIGRLPDTFKAITYNGLAAFDRGIRVK